ncbi:hypothetical protein BP6252_02901 [Coleophoma cylindrospora]|uniref:Uncharacterized protein n=1 Tax=Coleophoma cylindrospora TaxID=1849047 RepID=A0A3D8SGK1_9HELO|nr:hypothetical protein BP6252_02901 [Coleophoma cylindrospora]
MRQLPTPGDDADDDNISGRCTNNVHISPSGNAEGIAKLVSTLLQLIRRRQVMMQSALREKIDAGLMWLSGSSDWLSRRMRPGKAGPAVIPLSGYTSTIDHR